MFRSSIFWFNGDFSVSSPLSLSLSLVLPTEIRSSRSVKTSTLSQVPNEKDYFQVTDELAKENSHFAVSEALLAVIEQVAQL